MLPLGDKQSRSKFEGLPVSKKKLNVAMVGSGFIAKVHSNAFRQVGHFFDIPYEVCCKVICGRNPRKAGKGSFPLGLERG